MGQLRESLVGATVVVVVLGGLAGMSNVLDPQPLDCPPPPSPSSSSGSSAHHHDGDAVSGPEVVRGESCNAVEMSPPGGSGYVPNVAAASTADRAKAQKLLDGVNDFCAEHSVEDVAGEWRAGSSNPSAPTHFFNPDRYSRGLDPDNPRAALVYDGKIAGVMFTGRPLPALGSIPRAHIHNLDRPVEMLHVYCTDDLEEAFTPNRRLGVNADLRPLRLRIRPAVVDLDESQLRAVLAVVRSHAGDDLEPVVPIETESADGPDPVLQAMRIEIRRSLLLLDEVQLREVWALTRSN